jgi:uncharacterized protein
MSGNKSFPENMVPLTNEPFQFECHPGVACFTKCCRNVDMFLYPYDVLRLKNSLGVNSEKFVREYVNLVKGDNPFFPSLMLKLLEDEEKLCPFLNDDGCSVYEDRPSACRTYPLERAVDRSSDRGRHKEFYFLTNHSYCLGHFEDNSFTVKEWTRNQRIDQFNLMNDLWAEIDTLFASNPWKGEGAGGERQQMSFMVCYNIDGFRKFAEENKLLQRFKISKAHRRRIESDDEELLKFGFEWLKLILSGRSSLVGR